VLSRLTIIVLELLFQGNLWIYRFIIVIFYKQKLSPSNLMSKFDKLFIKINGSCLPVKSIG